jgi:hypothetical protein
MLNEVIPHKSKKDSDGTVPVVSNKGRHGIFDDKNYRLKSLRDNLKLFTANIMDRINTASFVRAINYLISDILIRNPALNPLKRCCSYYMNSGKPKLDNIIKVFIHHVCVAVNLKHPGVSTTR